MHISLNKMGHPPIYSMCIFPLSPIKSPLFLLRCPKLKVQFLFRDIISTPNLIVSQVVLLTTNYVKNLVLLNT